MGNTDGEDVDEDFCGGRGGVVAEQVLLLGSKVPVDPVDSRQLDFVALRLRGFDRLTCGDGSTDVLHLAQGSLAFSRLPLCE